MVHENRMQDKEPSYIADKSPPRPSGSRNCEPGPLTVNPMEQQWNEGASAQVAAPVHLRGFPVRFGFPEGVPNVQCGNHPVVRPVAQHLSVELSGSRGEDGSEPDGTGA